MVGIVVVSHSRKVAEGVLEIARQMSGEGVVIKACGGARDGSIGTDPDAIAAAVRDADDGDGVVLLVDLGSAVMSAEMVIDTLPQEMKNRAVVANAPLVEGTVVAAVQASMGNSLVEVLKAAEDTSSMQKVIREG